MTVSEEELMRRAAEKGRSASFCAPSQSPQPYSSRHSSQELFSEAVPRAQMDEPHGSELKVSSSIARRSQSCRVQGSRPPRSKRRESSKDSRHNDEDRGTPEASGSRRNSGYGGSIRKVPSCGRLVTLAPDDYDDLNGSPILRRTASARRALPPTGSPNHSPTPTRNLRPGTQKGRPGSRRGTPGSVKRSQGAGYLDVRGSAETLDPEAVVLRNFSTTHKGIVNRGDSFRRRRSRSNSIQPPQDGRYSTTPNTSTYQLSNSDASPIMSPETPNQGTCNDSQLQPSICTPQTDRGADGGDEEELEKSMYRVAIIGATGVGKTALINQFQTSECINAFDCASAEDGEKTTSVSIVLNNRESELFLLNISTPTEFNELLKQPNPADGWMVVYSITDKASYQKANEELTRLQAAGLLRNRAVIIVANKCELVRSRAVGTEDGKDLAVQYGGKFMEISVGMNHKCDDLLVGTIRQLRIKADAAADDDEKERVPWTRNRSLMRASMKAKRVMNKIMGKSDTKHKNCEDFSC